MLNSGLFKTLLNGLRVLVSEARWRFDDNGLHVRAVDPANVAMVIANINPRAFDAYQTGEDEVVVGVDVDRLFEFAKSFGKKDLADISVLDGKMSVKVKNIDYTISLIDPTAIRKEPKIPELDLPAKVVMSVEDFRQILNAADKFSEHVVLETSDAGFRITADGDIDKVTGYFNESVMEFNGAEARAMFGIEYLKEFFKVPEKNATVEIRLGTNYPAWFTFEIQDGFTIEYILAPRIEAE